MALILCKEVNSIFEIGVLSSSPKGGACSHFESEIYFAEIKYEAQIYSAACHAEERSISLNSVLMLVPLAATCQTTPYLKT
jgi:hypothetical protein